MRVLVVDDHSLFRDGIISLLEAADLEIVGQVGDGQAAVDATLSTRPDLVLMDIDMPQLNGLEALRLIKEKAPNTWVVMLSVSDSDADLFEAIQSGADGYLLKSLTADEFLDMLDGLERGEAAMPRSLTARLMKNLANPSPQEAEPAPRLSEREYEVLELMADGLSNKAIAQALSVSEHTIKYHARNLMQKLNAHSRTEAVTSAIRTGLLNPTLSK